MKKQVVAVVLSLAMCTSMAAEASVVSAADFSSDVSVDAEATAVSEGIEDSVVTEVPEVTAEPDIVDDTITETDEAVDVDAEESTDDQTDVDFSSEGETITEEVSSEENTAEAAGAVKETANEKEASLLYTRWENENGKWKLHKLTKAKAKEAKSAAVGTEETTTETTTETTETVEADAETAGAVEETVENAEVTEEVQPEAVAEAADEATETVAAEQPATEEQPAEETGAVSEYYTAADGLQKITTLNTDNSKLFSGYYAFDKDGYLLTGRAQAGDGYYYFLTEGEVNVKNALSADIKTPYNSQLGQAVTNTWKWNAADGVFNYYGNENGKETAIDANKTYTIDGETYYLLSGGKPYVGDKKIGNYIYYFRAASGNDIPGKMACNGWFSKGSQWRYFDANGRYIKKGVGAYKLLSNSNNLYLLNANGYLIRNRKMTKGADRYYYLADGNGVVYREKLVKYGKYRYYFVSNGRRATWKKRWVKLPGAGNRYYYFGKVAGRVQEQKGIKKVTVNGKFVGWFYFSPAGNSYKNAWKSGRYYLADGRMASGVTKINGKYYFFQRSSSKSYKGKVYKGKWIKYNNKYYYASGSGVLAENGWKRIKCNGKFYYFYFQNCTAVTNKSGIKRGDTYGSLDSRGRFVEAGWVVVNNNRNYVRYIDPKTGKYVKNTTRWINGVQYRFNSKGYRVYDRTNEFKRSRYYLACDRVNGVMTVYTDKSMTIPIKTIRVSVGKAETPTIPGTFRLTRSQRWQPLMGPSWGQYGTHVVNGIFVHSVASGLMNGNNLPAGEYMKLGSPASHGCIRCCVADAKWVYDNCNGSTINVFDGRYTSDDALKGPLGRKAITPLRGSKTFDPTDPVYARK